MQPKQLFAILNDENICSKKDLQQVDVHAVTSALYKFVILFYFILFYDLIKHSRQMRDYNICKQEHQNNEQELTTKCNQP